jgi:hypothetical protein
MCKNTMTVIAAFMSILVVLFVSSCSIPLELCLFNNTSYKVLVVMSREEVQIESGESKTIAGVSYAHFSIVSEPHTFNYTIPPIDSSAWVWKGWGPFSKRMIYAQLEENGEIWITGPDIIYPATTFGEQPDGFPIQPNT